MANIKDRPYVGTWSLDGRKLVQHTPDALVYVNGSVALPGCRSCDGKINLQKFITEVSVEAGTDPNGASASFTMSVPLHSTDAFARDAKFLLHPGLEVHIYKRGYFPVKGLFSNLGEPLTSGEIKTEKTPPGEHKDKDEHADHSHEEPPKPTKGEMVHLGPGFHKRRRRGPPTQIVIHESGMNAVGSTERTLLNKDLGVHYIVTSGKTYSYGNPETDVFSHTPGFNSGSIGIEFNHAYHSKSGTVIPAPWFSKGKYTLPSQAKLEQLYKTVVLVAKQNNIPITYGSVSGGTYHFGAGVGKSGGIITHRGATSGKGAHTDGTFPQLYMVLRDRGLTPSEAYEWAHKIAIDPTLTLPQDPAARFYRGYPGNPGAFEARNPEGDFPVEKLGKLTKKRLGVGHHKGEEKGAVGGSAWSRADQADFADADILSVADKKTLNTLDLKVGQSLLERFGLQGTGIENVASYPYYQTFHGVVIQVSHSYSGGFQTITIQCASMLHFWQYHKINTNIGASVSEGGGLEQQVRGHRMNGWHPYQIIYWLHQTTFGTQMKVSDVFETQTTNQNAVDAGTGRGLAAETKINDVVIPSLMASYWERRFNDNIVNLRMHGFNGVMYSSLQAAFLSRDFGEKLSEKIKGRFGNKKGPAKLDAIVGLNLNNDRKLRGMLFSDSSLAGPAPGRKATFDQKSVKDENPKVNMADIQAFVWNLGQTAGFGTFEVTFVSKLDIAQKVMEVTGFEFYQDVDGDLIFKPPMWNLDTSSSRVYRIEDIDIINVSFDEKEPQCTYTTVKGNQTSADGMQIDLGADLGKKATYMDHRLVSKFGYRPFEFETTYLSDSRAMYYMGVARMDVINIATHSASVTIPLRPEMRPGYPVYIPYLDCHYYVRSMSHSYSVGGQCTTTLQLVGKRAKFYAPGVPGQTGIDAIDLSDTSLPQRPLEVQDGDGVPKLSGFPNVVLALDPKGINPMYYPTGADITRLETDADFRNFLRMASREGIGVLATQGDGFYTFNAIVGYDEVGSEVSKPVTFYFGKDVKAKASGTKKAVGAAKEIPEGAVEISKAAKQYQGFKAAIKPLPGGKKGDKPSSVTSDATVTAEIKQINAKLAANLAARKEITDKDSAEYNALVKERDQLRRDHRLWTGAKGNPTAIALLSSHAKQGAKLIFQLIEQFSARFFVASDPKSFEDITTHHLAQMLWNKKSNFSSNNVPGSYRYYSCSHPDPEHQGQNLITFRSPESGGVDVIETPQALSDEWADITVDGYVRTPDAVPGTYGPEAKIEEMRPVRGMVVQVNKPGFSEVRPTSEIRTIMFSTQLAEGNRRDQTYSSLRSSKVVMESLKDALRKRFTVKATGKSVEADVTIAEFFKEAWDEVATILWGAVFAGHQRFKIFNATADNIYTFIPIVWDSVFPETVAVFRTAAETGKEIGDFAYGKNDGLNIRIKGLTKPETWTDEDFLNSAGDSLARYLAFGVGVSVGEWWGTIDQAISDSLPSSQGNVAKITQEGADIILTAMADHIAAGFGVPVGTMVGSKQLSKGRHTTSTWSAVFPVSDAKGYEVVGSFQYGRGLDIEPGGVWDALRAQDPLSILDRKTTDDLISALIRGVPVMIEVEKELPGGKKVTTKQPMSGTQARGQLERKVLTSLRKNYSDQQLLDLGLLTPSKTSPTKFEFNLMNWISNQKEGVHKLPVVNAAFSLADLSFQQDGKVCDCKASEANSKIEAYGNEGFLSFVSGGEKGPTGFGTGDTDRASQWLITEAMAASVPHKQQQDAMRGVALDKPKFASFDEFKSSFTDPGDRLTQAWAENEARADAFKKGSDEAAQRSFDNVTKAFGGEVKDDGKEQV